MKSTNRKPDTKPPARKKQASTPIDISKAKPKARPANLSTDPGSRIPEPAFPVPPPQASFTLRQRRFLQLLREGNNITMACAIFGITRHAYHQWRGRTEGFRPAVAAARETHRQEIACAFHDADAYARSLIDMVQRDESLPATIRLRAANQLLRRPGMKDWLPSPLPEDLDPEDSWNDSPLDLPGFPNFADEFLPVSESTNGATESCCHGQSESCCHGQSEWASAARGCNLSDLQAPKAAAESHQSQASADPRQPTADAYSGCISNSPGPSINPLPNQQYPAIPASASPRSEIENHAYNAYSASPSEPGEPKARPSDSSPQAESQQPEATRAPASNSSPGPGPRIPDPGSSPRSIPSLSERWLSHQFLHNHESRSAFDTLLRNHIHAHQPATPAEELLVFRITQKAWLLRRLETWERVVVDSRVAKLREKHPNAAAPACIAMTLLEVKETSQTRFHERTFKLRKEHEETLDRLTARLDTLQLRRETKSSREDQRPFSFQQLASSETAFASTLARSPG